MEIFLLFLHIKDNYLVDLTLKAFSTEIVYNIIKQELKLSNSLQLQKH
jgi:hypothetical protein